MHYLPVRTTARPPRVAVAIPGPSIVEDEGYEWQMLVEGALAHLGRFWGGAAGVVVPVHHDGLGQPVLRALAAYDPDFVVPYVPSARECGKSLGARWIPDAAIGQMRSHLSSPLQDDLVHSPTIATRHGEPQSPLTACAIFADACATPGALEIQGDRDVALAVASRVGVMSERDHDDVIKTGRTVRAEAKQALQATVLDLAFGDVDSRGGWNEADFMASLPLARSRHSLSWLVPGVRRRDPTILVVGDEADDFCLAMVVDRLLGPGRGIWCPWAWLSGADDDPTVHQDALIRVLSDRHGGRGDRDPLVITSTSGTSDRIEGVADRLKRVKSRTVVWGEGEIQPDPKPSLKTELVEVRAPTEIPLGSPFAFLVDPERVHLPSVVPFDGGVSVGPLMPATPRLAEDHPVGQIHWIADGSVDAVSVPPRWSLREFASETITFGQARPGRDGVAWTAVSDFIGTADVARVHHLVRPTVREPDAYQVLHRLAEAAGYTMRPSSVAGFYHGMIDLWGGLDNVAADLRDDLIFKTLMAFVDPSRSAGVRPGNGDRLALRIRDVRKAGDFALTIPDAVDLVEGWIARSIVRRGLCLKCARCRHADFYPVEELGQTFPCNRCKNDEQLGTSWPLDTSGPPWYFRLDEVVVQALQHHAEVPILAVDAARRIGDRLGFRSGLALEVVDPNAKPRSKTLTDIDFFYLKGAQVVCGEAKANGRLELSEARTLADIGGRLTIDEIVFATTLDEWKPAAKKAVAQSFPTWRPTARFMTSTDLLSEP